MTEEGTVYEEATEMNKKIDQEIEGFKERLKENDLLHMPALYLLFSNPTKKLIFKLKRDWKEKMDLQENLSDDEFRIIQNKKMEVIIDECLDQIQQQAVREEISHQQVVNNIAETIRKTTGKSENADRYIGFLNRILKKIIQD